MASGVQVDDVVKDLYNDMKVNKANDKSSERIRLATFKIEKDKIIVKEKIREVDLGPNTCFEKFKEKLIDDECTYILYDCHYDTLETHKEELIFEMWCGPLARIKDRMIYASSKDALKKVFTGCKHNLEKCDREDFGIEAFIRDVLGKDVLRLEGRDVCAQQKIH